MGCKLLPPSLPLSGYLDMNQNLNINQLIVRRNEGSKDCIRKNQQFLAHLHNFQERHPTLSFKSREGLELVSIVLTLQRGKNTTIKNKKKIPLPLLFLIIHNHIIYIYTCYYFKCSYFHRCLLFTSAHNMKTLNF